MEGDRHNGASPECSLALCICPGLPAARTSANKQFTRRRADARLARRAGKEVDWERPGTRCAVLRPALAGS